jgi:hypothetical protein
MHYAAPAPAISVDSSGAYGIRIARPDACLETHDDGSVSEEGKFTLMHSTETSSGREQLLESFHDPSRRLAVNLAKLLDQPGTVYGPHLIEHDLTVFCLEAT